MVVFCAISPAEAKYRTNKLSRNRCIQEIKGALLDNAKIRLAQAGSRLHGGELLTRSC